MEENGMANTKKAPGKERSTAEVEAAVKEMETQSVKDSTKEAAAGEKDSAKKNPPQENRDRSCRAALCFAGHRYAHL